MLFIEKFQLYISGTNIDATEYDFKKALDLLRYIDKVNISEGKSWFGL